MYFGFLWKPEDVKVFQTWCNNDAHGDNRQVVPLGHLQEWAFCVDGKTAYMGPSAYMDFMGSQHVTKKED